MSKEEASRMQLNQKKFILFTLFFWETGYSASDIQTEYRKRRYIFGELCDAVNSNDLFSMSIFKNLSTIFSHNIFINNKNQLLEFYNFPAEYWVHLRTTNPIESTFATVRLRTENTKGCLSRKTWCKRNLIMSCITCLFQNLPPS